MKFIWCSLMPLITKKLPINIHHHLQFFFIGAIFSNLLYETHKKIVLTHKKIAIHDEYL